MSGFVVVQAFSLTVAFAVQGACLVPVFWWIVSRPESRVGRVLNHRIVARIGVWSFSIYLSYRLALGSMLAATGSEVLADVLAVPVTLAAAALVWCVGEEPCRKLRQRLQARTPRQRQPVAANAA